MSDLVNLSISPEIIKPIVETKIKEAIAAALGGHTAIVDNVVKQVLSQKVNAQGNVSSYSSDNKFTWIDAVVTNQIKEMVREEVIREIAKTSSLISKSIAKYLKSNEGSSQVAKVMCEALNRTLESSYRSTIQISLDSNNPG